MAKIKVVHYINQFFAGIGGEEKADIPAELHKAEVIGPGMAFNTGFGDEAEIIATIVCGDSYFNENIDAAKAEMPRAVETNFLVLIKIPPNICWESLPFLYTNLSIKNS